MDDTRKRCIVNKLRRHDNRRRTGRGQMWPKLRIGQKRDLPGPSRCKSTHLRHHDRRITFKLPA